jgi:hypothetical protein
VEFGDGDKKWYIDDTEYTELEYNSR